MSWISWGSVKVDLILQTTHKKFTNLELNNIRTTLPEIFVVIDTLWHPPNDCGWIKSRSPVGTTTVLA